MDFKSEWSPTQNWLQTDVLGNAARAHAKTKAFRQRVKWGKVGRVGNEFDLTFYPHRRLGPKWRRTDAKPQGFMAFGDGANGKALSFPKRGMQVQTMLLLHDRWREHSPSTGRKRWNGGVEKKVLPPTKVAPGCKVKADVEQDGRLFWFWGDLIWSLRPHFCFNTMRFPPKVRLSAEGSLLIVLSVAQCGGCQ